MNKETGKILTHGVEDAYSRRSTSSRSVSGRNSIAADAKDKPNDGKHKFRRRAQYHATDVGGTAQSKCADDATRKGAKRKSRGTR